MSKELIDMNAFLGKCPTHKKLPWKIGAVESGRVAIDSDDGKEVTGWLDPEDAYLILNQQQRIEELESKLASRDAEVVSLTNQRDYEYVRAENAEQERDQLREQIASLKDELRQISTAIDDVRLDLTNTAAELIMEMKEQLSSRDAEIEGHKGRFAKDQDRIACQAEQLAQKNAEITECDALRDRMSEILSATAIAINGPEPELTKWSWHDLSEKAGALKQQVAELVAALVEIRDDFDCDKDAHKYGTTCRCCLANATLAKVRKP